MTTRTIARESRSVRLSQEEWDLAEVIAHMMCPDNSATAGLGLRQALRMAADRLRRQGRGPEMAGLLAGVLAARSDGAEVSR